MAKGKRLQLLTELLSDEQVKQLILEQLGQFVVIGDTEPDHGPVLWFDTTKKSPDEPLTVILVFGDEDEESDIMAVINEEDYPVINADSPTVADDGESYIINLS